MKTVLYRLFGLGRIPETVRARLDREGLLIVEEGIRGSVTYRNFRAPGKRFVWKRQWYTAAVAVTESRLLTLRTSRPIIDIPFADERFDKLQVAQEERDTLAIAFEAGLFHGDWSGTIEYRFRTPEAQRLAHMLRQRAAI